MDRRSVLGLGASLVLLPGSAAALPLPAIAGTLPPIDIHPHIASKDEARYPITPIGGKRSDWSAERSVTLEELLAAMDMAGVARAAVVHSSTTYGFDCRYCADSVARYPKRLTGVFSVDATARDAPAMMRHWYGLGCTGMRIFTRGSTMKQAWLALDDPRILPCYRQAEALGIPVAVNIKSDQFAQLDTVLRQFPRVRFILDSLGGADFSDGAPYDSAAPLWQLARHPNLYLQLVTGNFARACKGKADPETLFPKIVAEYGSARMAWGSDYPSAEGSLAGMVQLARETVASLSGADQDNLFHNTAISLYPALRN